MTFDLVIVGGGIAGCVAALRSAQLGLSAMLLAGRPQAHKRPPEQVPEAIEQLFSALDAGREFGRAVVSRTSTMELARVGKKGDSRPWTTLNIERTALDAALLQACASRGVQVVHDDRATITLRAGGRVSGVQTEKGLRVPSRWTIDATGQAGWLSRTLRLQSRVLSPQLFAWRDAVQVLNAPTPGQGLFTPCQDGWTLLVAERDRVIRTRMLSGESLRARTPKISEQREFQGARDVTWRLIRPLAGPGYFIAGEAGGQIDPACGQGVRTAALSGIRAAESALRCLREPTLAGAHLAWYDSWFLEHVLGMAETLREMYRDLSIKVFDGYKERGYESV
jgi:flavin-dependent dehydrogenase